jgi:hypothetical protein
MRLQIRIAALRADSRGGSALFLSVGSSAAPRALPSAETAAMLFWALLASGQINMRNVDGWQTLDTKPIAQPIGLAA